MKKMQCGSLNWGSYILILHLSEDKKIRIGRLGRFNFPRGFYAYSGSAFGPGGLSSRLNHHLRIAFKPHWHIDYLRRKADLIEAWVSQQKDRQEHIWASRLLHLDSTASPIAKFGCSDCKCLTHLYHFLQQPSFQIFKKLAQPTAQGGHKISKINLN